MSALREWLLELFALTYEPPNLGAMPHPPVPYRVSGFGEEGVLYVGRSLTLFGLIVAEAAGNSFEGGHHATAVERQLDEACRRARRDTPELVADELVAALGSPTSRWNVAAEARDGFPQVVGEASIGRVTFLRSDTPELAGFRSDWEGYELQPQPPIYATQVDAQDAESARIQALMSIEEARAILALGGSPRRPRPNMMLLSESGQGEAGGRAESRLYPWPMLRGTGGRLLSPGFHELSQEASHPPAERSEWGRRVLTAARWTHEALIAWWPDKRIAASFAALEALHLEPRATKKKRKLATRVSATLVLQGMTAESQRLWLRDLYDEARGGALHEGTPYQNDRAAEQLETLALHMTRWGVWHLDPFHAEHGACLTLDDVRSPELHRRDP